MSKVSPEAQDKVLTISLYLREGVGIVGNLHKEDGSVHKSGTGGEKSN